MGFLPYLAARCYTCFPLAPLVSFPDIAIQRAPEDLQRYIMDHTSESAHLVMKDNPSSSEIDTVPYSVYIAVMASLLLLGISIPLFFWVLRRRARAKVQAQNPEIQLREQRLQGGMQNVSQRDTNLEQAQGLPHPDHFSVNNLPA